MNDFRVGHGMTYYFVIAAHINRNVLLHFFEFIILSVIKLKDGNLKKYFKLWLTFRNVSFPWKYNSVYFVYAQALILILINIYVDNANMSLRTLEKDNTRKNTFKSCILIDDYTFC